MIQSLSNGGAERVVSVISSALAEQNTEVIVVKFFSTDKEYSVGDKVQIINLSEGNIQTYRRMNRIKVIFGLRQIIQKNKPNCIIPFTYPVAQITDLATISLPIDVFQSIRINPAVSPAKKWMRVFRDRLVYKSKCSFVQNKQQKEYFKKRYRNKIHVLFNPVSDDLFEVEPKVSNGEFMICSLGRLTDQKNFPMLIDAFVIAFRNDPSVKLHIYGEGVKRDWLDDYIKKCRMDKQIKMMGRTNDVKRVFQESDLFVLSSDWEGMPNALIEAMACRVLSIATDCPTGPSDLIINGINGYLVPVNDKYAMANCMKKVRNMSYQERMIISDKGRSTIKSKCSSHTIAKEMIDICEAVYNHEHR